MMKRAPKTLWAKPIACLAGAGSVALATAAVLLTGPQAVGAPDPTAITGQNQADVRLVDCMIPDQARETLRKIDAGNWPPDDAPGTRGGDTWNNREAALPKKDGDGNLIRYLVWDVNPEKGGQPRDRQRIVTGSDGSARYSPDNGNNFCKMR